MEGEIGEEAGSSVGSGEAALGEDVDVPADPFVGAAESELDSLDSGGKVTSSDRHTGFSNGRSSAQQEGQ